MAVDLDELEAMHSRSTPGEWRTIADSFTPPEHFIVCGPGVFGSEQIAGPSAAMPVNADYECAVAEHNAMTDLIAELRLLREQREQIECEPYASLVARIAELHREREKTDSELRLLREFEKKIRDDDDGPVRFGDASDVIEYATGWLDEQRKAK